MGTNHSRIEEPGNNLVFLVLLGGHEEVFYDTQSSEDPEFLKRPHNPHEGDPIGAFTFDGLAHHLDVTRRIRFQETCDAVKQRSLP